MRLEGHSEILGYFIKLTFDYLVNGYLEQRLSAVWGKGREGGSR